VLDCKAVTQVDVLETHQIVLVLADKTLYSYSLEALDPEESQAMAKRPRKICHANFFKSGVCMGQHLVATVKTSALSSTIKVYEPKESMANKAKRSGFSKMLSTGQDQLKPFKEFYIPTESSSMHFLRSKLCVGCARGFEVVSLETLETQSLLDQADTSLDFVVRKENVKAIHIERLASEFLLCYSDYSFFVNRDGWRARPDWRITWEGNPQAFAVFHPYILAFEPSFIEIRHMESGGMVHILTAKNIRWLHTSTREVRLQHYQHCETTNMTRYYTPTKTKWATMSLRAWISGRLLTVPVTKATRRAEGFLDSDQHSTRDLDEMRSPLSHCQSRVSPCFAENERPPHSTSTTRSKSFTTWAVRSNISHGGTLIDGLPLLRYIDAVCTIILGRMAIVVVILFSSSLGDIWHDQRA
jgi:hypothetical protein